MLTASVDSDSTKLINSMPFIFVWREPYMILFHNSEHNVVSAFLMFSGFDLKSHKMQHWYSPNKTSG